jgi:hypothetical protein
MHHGAGRQPGRRSAPARQAGGRAKGRVQAKFFAAKSQLARLARKVSTNFGRALR